MSKTPFMPLWVSDFLGDTLDLDAAEIGAYMLLLMAQWNRDGRSLPDDQNKLKRVARCGRNWPKIWDVIGRFFERDAEGVYSKRLRLEHQNVAAKREVNRQSGALGGKAKALKSKEPDLANATVSLQRNPSIPEPEPYIDRDTNVSLALFAPECEPNPPDRFDEFWDQYPHRGGAKKGKDKARQSWARLVKAKTPQGDIIAGALRYAQDRMVLSGYAKDPATWLNQKGWQDDIERTDNHNGSGPSGSGGGMVAAFAAVAARATAKRQ